MVFSLGPPNPSSSTRVISSLSLISENNDAVPFGSEALNRLGGITKVGVDVEVKASDFPEERIVIPVGVTPQNLKNYTLYDMLGFTPEWADSADVEAIKKAYHKAVLMYHPDKAQYKTAEGKEDRTVFLKIQEAFNVLSNEQKRRAYDSQLPFDETIPTEEKVNKALAKGNHKFFKLFDPVFKRNARFAAQKPVPELGDMETPIEQVYRFYDYWIKFESWRDFTGVGAEHNPDNAGSREEKRYMQKENERLAKKLKKKEMDRIIELVMLAEKKDPRIVADKERRRAAKDTEKNAKEAHSKRKAEEEAAAAAWSNAAEAEVLARGNLSKADKEKLKKAQSNARNILRKLLRASATQGHGSGEYGIVSAADVDILCTNSDLEDLNTMNAALGGVPASKDPALFLIAGAEEVLSRLAVMKGRQAQAAEDERIVREAKRRDSEEKSSRKPAAAATPASRDWTREMQQALSTALLRYPVGSASRWQMVSYYLTDQLHPAEPFTETECLVAAHKASLASAFTVSAAGMDETQE